MTSCRHRLSLRLLCHAPRSLLSQLVYVARPSGLSWCAAAEPRLTESCCISASSPSHSVPVSNGEVWHQRTHYTRHYVNQLRQPAAPAAVAAAAGASTSYTTNRHRATPSFISSSRDRQRRRGRSHIAYSSTVGVVERTTRCSRTACGPTGTHMFPCRLTNAPAAASSLMPTVAGRDQYYTEPGPSAGLCSSSRVPTAWRRTYDGTTRRVARDYLSNRGALLRRAGQPSVYRPSGGYAGEEKR